MPGSETRQQLLEAALSVMARSGLEGLTMRGVADEANAALGSIQYHFGDKDDLVNEAFGLLVERMVEASLFAVSDVTDPEARVIAFIRAAFSTEIMDSDFLPLRLTLWAAAPSRPDIAAINEALHQHYLERLSSLIADARPSMTRAEAERRAADVMITENGMWLRWVISPDCDELNRCIARCSALALGN